ncbi:hypothetical protein QR685DRAFT_575545 [Neurospora intermedia]|uniref:Uncharacterized protein n=1 Tax=Neurospora intermedia TaxID=5142 RepID=A0ABR3D239_NEUIN
MAKYMLASHNNDRCYISKTNILYNLYIATYYLIRRFELFKEYILMPKFKFDHFYLLGLYKYVIIDEKSIPGIRTIYYINPHLRQAFLASANILLLRDFF